MASITCESNGRKTIQFIGVDEKRRSVRLGKVSGRTAEAVKVKIEHLAGAVAAGQAVDEETSRWLTQLDDALYDKLAAVELVPERQRTTLGSFLENYIAQRVDVKAGTALVFGHTQRNLLEFFGPNKPLRVITPGDADEWRLSLIGQGLADNTVRRRCGIAKQFFQAAVRKGLVRENPFVGLKASVQANASRFYFISREEARKVLDACPDVQWRLLFALSRYGGLRCPSEHLALTWQDVDWAENRLTVRSPKTEHHVGGESRTIPLFPELRPYLLEAFEQAEPGSSYVITRYRDSNANLRTQFERIIGKAGLTPWPKLFQNLRSTRETELAEQFPLHVVCQWIGNSQPVAAKHYLQVTDEHYRRAAGEAVQNPVQQGAKTPCNPMQGKTADMQKPAGKQGNARTCRTLQASTMGDTGLEPVTPSL